MRTPARGFTLIELMVVVAIVGLLSSVAVPSFRNFQLRSKTAERILLMTSIQRSTEEFWIRDAKFPYDYGPGTNQSLLYLLMDNPDASPSIRKRPWRLRTLNSLDHWSKLSLMVQGAVYYSYRGYAMQYPTYRYYQMRAYGDLDGDAVQNTRLEEVYYDPRGTIYRWGGNVDCPACTYVTVYNPTTF